MDDILLFAGEDGDPETGDGWLPAITLQHDGIQGRNEMFVVVGEEVSGMVEGVNAATFEKIRERVLG